jgi:hypothetical protein
LSTFFKRHSIPVLFLALVLTAVFYPALFEGRSLLPTDMFDTMTLPYSAHYDSAVAFNRHLTDGQLQGYPWVAFEQRALRSGHIAAWNPLIVGGYPKYASTSQFFSVFNILLLWVDLPLAFNLVVILPLLLAGIGMYFLLNYCRVSLPVALIFATAYMLNGMFLAHLLNMWAQATFCWMPLVMLSLLKYLDTRRTGYFLTCSLLLALGFFGANLQSAMYLVFVLVTFGFVYGKYSLHESFWKSTWRSFRIIALAVALSAIMWVPSLELFFNVVREGELYSSTHTAIYGLLDRLFSIPLLFTFFIPELAGGGEAFNLHSLAHVHPLDFSGTIGFLPLLVALFGISVLWKRSSQWTTIRPKALPYAVIATLAIILPIATPLSSWLYHRFFVVADFALCVLGALTLERLLERAALWTDFLPWYRWSRRIVLAVFLGLTIFTFLAAIRQPLVWSALNSLIKPLSAGRPYADGNEKWMVDRISATIQHYSFTSLTMIVPFMIVAILYIVLYLFRKYPEIPAKHFAWGFLALLVVQLFFFWRSWQPFNDTKVYPAYPQTEEIRYLEAHLGDARMYVDPTIIPHRQYVFINDQPSMYGIAEIKGYESEMPRSTKIFIERHIDPTHPHIEYLGLAGVKYIVTGIRPSEDPRLLKVDSGAIQIFENPFAKPRAFLSYRTGVTGNDSDLAKNLLDSSLDGYTVFLEHQPQIPLLRKHVEIRSKITPREIEDNALSYEVESDSSGYFILSDLYYPGWQCSIDSQGVPILRANYSMRAVYLPAGKHVIHFAFKPITYEIGKWISLLSFLVCLTFGISLSRKREPRTK